MNAPVLSTAGKPHITGATPAVIGSETRQYACLDAICFDLADAQELFRGNHPVIAHPPRHLCGRVRQVSTRFHRQETELSMWMLSQVRAWGGVLEHPANSGFWRDAGLPGVGAPRDQFDGLTLPVWLSWWGGPHPRPTWLYLVGYDRPLMPPMPLDLERTAVADDGFARWLIGLARTIGVDQAWRYDCRKRPAC